LCTVQENINSATGSQSGGGIGSYVGKFCAFVNCEFSLSTYLLGGDLLSNFNLGNSNSQSLGERNAPQKLSEQSDSGNSGSDSGGDSGSDSESGGGLFGDIPFAGMDGISGDNAGRNVAEFLRVNQDNSDGETNSIFATVWNRGIDATNARTEDSLVLSTLNMCIPGIIKNLNEYRQIKCRYALCLQDEVPQGVPLEACEAEQAYATCKYVFGEIFMLIPFVNLFDQFMNQLKLALNDPITMIGSLWGGLCAASCPGGWLADKVPEGWHSACAVQQLFTDLGVAVGNVMAFIDGSAFNFEGQPDVCGELDDE